MNQNNVQREKSKVIHRQKYSQGENLLSLMERILLYILEAEQAEIQVCLETRARES